MLSDSGDGKYTVDEKQCYTFCTNQRSKMQKEGVISLSKVLSEQ